MIQCGIGPTQLNNLLTAMNLPSIWAKVLKHHKNEASEAITAVAVKACNKAIDKEKHLL